MPPSSAIEEKAVDSAAQALNATLNQLMPIRRQRLSRAERQLRQEEQELLRIEHALRKHQQHLAQQQDNYQRHRETFRRQAVGKTQTLESLKNQLEEEQKHIRQVHAQILLCTDWQKNYLAQQQRVSDAREGTRLNQKAVEKLEFLLTLKQERL
ncbi:type III secretion protein [Pectobacteriaceae bacterium CE70]|nr:type III secretion protein [Pectobacteriaceae bacterium C52]WJV68844.1 type III secretion protein [Pectobacteriaceae bacterium CE70]WJY12767.1 type III secretion protein [Pectobacteriaceae bacterium C80]